MSARRSLGAKGHLLSIPVNTPGMNLVYAFLQFNLSLNITNK